MPVIIMLIKLKCDHLQRERKFEKQILFHQIFLGQRHSVIVIISSWSLPGCLMITITIVIIMVWFSKVSLAEPRTSGAGQQFENGDVIVTLLPVNERFPWVTPARSAAVAHF